METFSYKGESLFCEKVNLDEVARSKGTPLYVYSYRSIVESYDRIARAFAQVRPLICYSLKANSNLSLLRILSQRGVGADIVSAGELYKALRAGFSSEKIVFAGVGKREEEIEYALREKILMFNVESASELRVIDELSRRLNREARISFRVNPDVDPKTHHYITTGKEENKFGLDFAEAKRLYEKARQLRRVKLVGIHMHIGSQITSSLPYLEALEKVAGLVEELREEGISLEYLDIGGGFGIGYEEGTSSLEVEDLARKTVPIVQKMRMKLILEPGRYIIGPAGVLVSRVLYRKKTKKKTFLIVDAGMNDLIRPSLYGAYHRIKKVKRPDEMTSFEVVDVVGPVCESGDFFAQERALPEIEEGEYLAIMDAGAYGFSMSSSYNSRPRAAEVLVREDKWWTIRERESLEDLIKGEHTLEEKDGISCQQIPFTKMEGCGNDFIVIDNRSNLIQNRAEFARRVCARRTGIGADGLLLVENSKEADFKMRTFNPDGTEPDMCGNGARCIARFAYLKGIAKQNSSFWTPSGKIVYQVEGEDVKIKMKDPSDLKPAIKLNIGGKLYEGHFINTGVPHLVLFVEEVEKAPLKNLAPLMRYHQLFQPEGTNVDFVEIEKGVLKVRTYERGVEGETLGCGTGAVASSLISSLIFGLPSPVKVRMRGGRLLVYFQKRGDIFTDVFLEGKAKVVYEGYIPSSLMGEGT